MSAGSDFAQLATVAVAVKGGGGGQGGRGSRRAVRWAVNNLADKADRFILIHVTPEITSVPTPSGEHIPFENLDANVVKMYVEEVKSKCEEIFVPFKKLCKPRKVETLVLEGDNVAAALLNYVSNSDIRSLVLGSCYFNCIRRKLKRPSVPSLMLKNAPQTCGVFVVSRHRLMATSLQSLPTDESSSKSWLFNKQYRGSFHSMKLKYSLYASSTGHRGSYSFGTSEALSDHSSMNSRPVGEGNRSFQNADGSISENQRLSTISSSSSSSKKVDVQAEVERLRLELQNTVVMYNQACEHLIHAKNKVRMLSSECIEEVRKVNAAQEREEMLRKIATEENQKYLVAMKEIEKAKCLLSIEAYERELAELKARYDSIERKKIVDALLSNDRRYRQYSEKEIENATDSFSVSKLIGEGSYGKVYRCQLDHIPVAIKVCQNNAHEKKAEFLKEVEILSQLRHPHLVLLLGACPENGSLVYEYMENGSLEDHILRKNCLPPLPWPARFRILFEVACGLAFLHSSKPEPIIHRDVKPGNIFVDRNYVSKIGDVGLAKLISDQIPDNVTEYRESIIAGTLHYMDPEYYRTGTVRPKSDLYAFGIICLQMLCSQSPKEIVPKFEAALSTGCFVDMLDDSIKDWPLAEAEELAKIALKCTRLKCRERPELETEVLPILKKLSIVAESGKSKQIDDMTEPHHKVNTPDHYYCPILQEVMEDPQIAADGFTYEHIAIKKWLERYNISPVTKTKLKHKILVPNHTLQSAIIEWKSQLALPFDG
ncbi:U-box domain-containing protein 34-like [Impatiens glandulifera]|uniref:U-box domain-containing protein 34-like n=1 Tax=Impatiens glandulifera TaxID=253017 RepID=UPI001FB07607|nr:U-box domain-containing protein 34-like [Impatiens glandulifera]